MRRGHGGWGEGLEGEARAWRVRRGPGGWGRGPGG